MRFFLNHRRSHRHGRCVVFVCSQKLRHNYPTPKDRERLLESLSHAECKFFVNLNMNEFKQVRTRLGDYFPWNEIIV
jgi:hypothetical protein